MPIRVECPACRSGFNVRDDFAGKRGKCPQCKTPIDVPAARSEPALSRRAAEPEAHAEESDTYMLADAAPKVRAVPVRGGQAVGGSWRTRRRSSSRPALRRRRPGFSRRSGARSSRSGRPCSTGSGS